MKVPWESWSIVYIVLHIYFVSRYISVSSGKDGDHEGERDDLELDDDEGSLQARLHPGLGLAHRPAARHPRLEQRLQRHHHRQEPRTLHAGLSFSRWERSVGLIMLLRFSRGWISVINIRWLPTTMANALFIKHRQKMPKVLKPFIFLKYLSYWYSHCGWAIWLYPSTKATFVRP